MKVIDPNRLSQLRAALARFPRLPLAVAPTPLQRLERLSRELGTELWLKRDDLTGLALGGNKVRKLEFLLGQARAEGADTLVTTGSSQSNHARMTAAAARAAGLDCRLVLERGRHLRGGNLLLDALLGAPVELVDGGHAAVAARMGELAEELRRDGRRPLLLPLGGSSPTGVLGYLVAGLELAGQLEGRPATVYVATSSCGTHAGLVAAFTHLGLDVDVRGVSVSHGSAVQEAEVSRLAHAALDLLGLPAELPEGAVRVDDTHVGEDYGVPTDGMWDALRRLARTEGILLDPVYTGKAMAGLLHDVATGRVAHERTVVFLHTGGTPALFAYGEELQDELDTPASPRVARQNPS